MIGITKRDLAEWKESPVTRAYYQGIQAKIRLIEQNMANYLNMENPYYTTAIMAKLVGQIEGLKDALEIDDTTVLGDDE